MSWYLDSSAILKLIFHEPESDFLFDELSERRVTSHLSRIEVTRVVQRVSPQKLSIAKLELGKYLFIPISEPVIRIAETFTESPTLRSLDAIHVASALLVQSSIQGLISYDQQMLTNARALGLKVLSPGIN